jgi:valyl-tRNA synthetase
MLKFEIHRKKKRVNHGKCIDPLDVIGQYGCEALRFMLANNNSPVMMLDFNMKKLNLPQNIANKIRHAAIFVEMNLDIKEIKIPDVKNLTTAINGYLANLLIRAELPKTLKCSSFYASGKLMNLFGINL